MTSTHRRPRRGLRARLGALAFAALALGACNALPTAAAVNGTTVSMADVNALMASLSSTPLGQCYLAVEAQGQVPNAAGAGGSGTYGISFADVVIEQEVVDVLMPQLASREHVHVDTSPAGASQARSELAAQLDNDLQSEAQSGAVSSISCPALLTSTPTGQQMLAALPASFQAQRIAYTEAADALLAAGVDTSPTAIARFYLENPDDFVNDCVSVIVTGSQADAASAMAKLKAGTPFADVAKADSIDTSTAANGGQDTCSVTRATVKSSLQVASLAVGQPIGPIQDPSQPGTYAIFEVTSETPIPLAQAAPTITEAITHGSANENRVSNDLASLAQASHITVDPRFGSWSLGGLIPPAAPRSDTLLPAVGGVQPSTSGGLPGLGTSLTSPSSGSAGGG